MKAEDTGKNWIRVHMESVDGWKHTRCFRYIAAARRYASNYVGMNPIVSEMGYAVSDDGIQVVTVSGSVTINELFQD